MTAANPQADIEQLPILSYAGAIANEALRYERCSESWKVQISPRDLSRGAMKRYICGEALRE